MAAAAAPCWTSGIDLVKAAPAPTFTPATALVLVPPAPTFKQVKPECSHPWDDVKQDLQHGYTCTLCDTPLIFCWQCATDGKHNMHPAPECDPGHMTVVRQSPRTSIYDRMSGGGA
jgi:hypothetical protein